MLRFDKATYLSLIFKFILCERLSIRCFTIFRVDKYSIHFVNLSN